MKKLCSRLLFFVTSGQKSNFSDKFKLKTCNNLPILLKNIMKML